MQQEPKETGTNQAKRIASQMNFFTSLWKDLQKTVTFQKKSPIYHKFWLIGNRTSCRPIRSVVIILVIIKTNRALATILLITRMITDRIGLYSVLLPLLIFAFRATNVLLDPYRAQSSWRSWPQER